MWLEQGLANSLMMPSSSIWHISASMAWWRASGTPYDRRFTTTPGASWSCGGRDFLSRGMKRTFPVFEISLLTLIFCNVQNKLKAGQHFLLPHKDQILRKASYELWEEETICHEQDKWPEVIHCCFIENIVENYENTIITIYDDLCREGKYPLKSKSHYAVCSGYFICLTQLIHREGLS